MGKKELSNHFGGKMSQQGLFLNRMSLVVMLLEDLVDKLYSRGMSWEWRGRAKGRVERGWGCQEKDL